MKRKYIELRKIGWKERETEDSFFLQQINNHIKYNKLKEEEKKHFNGNWWSIGCDETKKMNQLKDIYDEDVEWNEWNDDENGLTTEFR